MDPASKSPLVRRLHRLAVALIVLLVAFEIALRILSLFPGSSPFYVSDAQLGFRVRPRAALGPNPTNARGFNDDEPAPHVGPLRCVFIGDSFTFGGGPRKDNFVEAFQALASGHSGLETVNLGIPGAGPENYLRVLQYEPAVKEAKVVFVIVFIGNDIAQGHPDFKSRVWLGGPRAQLRSPWLVRASPDYWYSTKTLRAGWRLLRWMMWERSRSGEGALPDDVFLEIEMQNLGVCRRKPSTYMQSCYDGTLALLDAMRIEADRQHIKLAVVLAPDQFQVDTALREQLFSRFHLDGNDYDLDRPQRVLRASLEGQSVPVLDLLPAFRVQETKEQLYLPRDTHWNARGNALAAREMYAFATERGLLPPH
jgi:lysophospholipase L1-like esterase